MKHVSRWTAGDGGAYSLSHRGAGQVLKKTGRDRLTLSTAVRLQDGLTAPLRTLGTKECYTLMIAKQVKVSGNFEKEGSGKVCK